MPKWTDKQLRTVFRRSGGRCHICKRGHAPEGYGRVWNVEHLQPKSLGGSDQVNNLAVACIRCNSRKGNAFGMSDMVTAVSNEVVDRMKGNSFGFNNRGPSGSGRRNRRRGRCQICGANAYLTGSFCNNCDQKSRRRPMKKLEGECAYARCTEPVASSFFGFFKQEYCQRHQNQHNRGLI